MSSIDQKPITISRSSSYSSHLAGSLTTFKNNEELTDFSISTGGKVFPCHRVILAANSDVLHRMIVTAMKEKQSNEVVMNSIPPEIMKVVLEFMYTGEANFLNGQLLELVQASDYLHMLELQALCIEKVPEVLSTTNVLSWTCLGNQLQADDILQECDELIHSSFQQIMKRNQFLELELAELTYCVVEAKNGLASSDDVMKSIFRWIDHDFDGRVASLGSLLENVDLKLCPCDDLQEIMASYSHILTANPKISKVFTAALTTASRKEEIIPEVQQLIVLDNKTCWKYDPSDRSMKESFKIPSETPIEYISSVCMYKDTGLIYTGGQNSSASCVLYEIDKKTWKMLPSDITRECCYFVDNGYRMKRKIGYLDGFPNIHVSVCLDEVLYIIGGTDEDEDCRGVSGVFSLALDNGSWQELEKLPRGMSLPKLAQQDSNVFVMSCFSDTLLQFNPWKKSWKELQSPPQPMEECFSMAVAMDRLLVAGGNGINCYYSISTDTWTEISYPTLSHDDGAMVFFNKKMVLLGGDNDCRRERNKKSKSGVVEEYSFEDDRWVVSDFKLPKGMGSYIHGFVLNMQL